MEPEHAAARNDCPCADALRRVEERGSAGERQLARMFARHGVRFQYERPVAVRDRGYLRLWYPDFWLPDADVYVEYAGGADSDARAERLAHKQAVYAAEGLACLTLGPEDLRGRWPKQLLKDIADVVRERTARHEAEARRLKGLWASRESGVYAWDRGTHT